MALEKIGFYTNILQGIEKGLARVELDRGGYWSIDNHIWVDSRFSKFVNSPLLSPEAKYIEKLGAIGFSVGRLFNYQLHHAEKGVMWPKELLAGDGAEKLLKTAESNPSILDPYSLISNGFEKPSTPYSITYKEELAKLNKELIEALKLDDSPSVKAHVAYLQALVRAYSYDRLRTSDLPFMEEADKAWVDIPSDSPILILVEPTETYYDPAKDVLGQHEGVSLLNKKVTDKTGQEIWRPFFEFKLMVKDESVMITNDEVRKIRETSKLLFKQKTDKVVPVSLEFRRLLLASGQGSHPVKMAKNYPNFENIRDDIGYKNVLYTNMIEEGTLTQFIPALKKAFGDQIVENFGEQQLVRGTTLRVVGHEENHPFRRFRDSPLEELKATVNGFKAIIESKQFSDNDINSALFTEIGAALFGRKEILEARAKNDKNKETSLNGYYRGDTILMHYFLENGVFKIEGDKLVGIDFNKLRASINHFSDYLQGVFVRDKANDQTAITKVYSQYYDEKVWNHFDILEIA